MVYSHLNKSIEYPETREIDAEDIDHISSIYLLEIYGKPHTVAIGKVKYTFSVTYEVVYFPIYLVRNTKIIGKVGVYELERNRLLSMMDKNKEPKVANLGEPVWFLKTTEDYMKKTHSVYEEKQEKKMVEEVQEKENEDDTSDKEEEEEDDVLSLKKPNVLEKQEKVEKNIEAQEKRISIDDVFTKDKTQPNVATLPTETEEESKVLKEEYEKTKSLQDNWIQTFMKNKGYAIKRNEGGGDCFFATIRDAFQEIGWQTTVQKLRAILAQEVTYDLFENYSAIYRGIINESEIAEHEMQQIATKNKNLKKQISSGLTGGGGLTGDKEQYKEMLAGAKVLNKKYNEIKKKNEIDQELLGDFGFMANVKTIEDLRTYVRTSNYWADTWAISTLERVLEIKIIILEESTDPNAVMQCGQLNDEMTTFSPKYYILANYTGGNHYELATYKKKGLFIFSEIPYGIKILVVNKCMERNAGPYAIIPAFRQFQSELGLEVAEPKGVGVEEKGLEGVERSDLYDPKYQFMFYHKSDSSKKPGDGSGEKPIPKNELTMFIGLIQKPALPWRQQLDDQWSNAAFTVDHLRWSSVAHYLIALPFRKTEPTIYKAFSLDGTDKDLSTDAKAAKDAVDKKREKGKTVEGKYYAKYKIVSKSGELGEDEMKTARKNALMAKFSQNADLTTMLLDTRQALLKQFHSGKEATADILLMTVRKSLKRNGN